MTDPAAPSRTRARLFIILAAVLWSLSGFFAKVLRHPTPLGLDSPSLDGAQIAFWRVLFAGLILVPTLRRADVSFRWGMVALVACFAAMNALYLRAMTEGQAANAVWLQYTAPAWIYLASAAGFGERPGRRGARALVLAMAGVAVILAFNREGEALRPVLLALGSGAMYAGVVLGLRALRSESSRWLTVLNHLGSAVLLFPWALGLGWPSAGQLGWLFLFGAVQMGLPYWLMARGLRGVTSQEAGTLTLLEPLLLPIWAYLVSGEVPGWPTFVGGSLIGAALVWQYWPEKEERP